jgi:energy-coupling factor transport system ATP-binding protein
MLQALAGVPAPHHHLEQTGVVEIGVAQSHRGYLPHNPQSIFLTTRVLDDVALGLIARGVGTKEAERKAQRMLDELGISHLSHHAPWMLSSGEAVMAGLAVVLVTTPQLVLLDEPVTALDSKHRSVFLQALARYQATTNAAVLLTHHPEDATTIPGFIEYVLTDQGLHPGRFSSTVVPPHRVATRPMESDVVAQVSNLSVVLGTRAILDDVTFDLHRGELVVISGRNGAGKSTLLEAVFDARLGSVQVLGQDMARVSPKDKVGLLAVVPSDPSSLFVTSSVAEELAWADRVAGVEKGFTRLAFESILPEAWHHEVMVTSDHTHPRDLSRGQQAALAVALQLSHKPAVIALDEPTRGLDESARKAFAEVIACVVETGTAVVVASHHDESDGLEPDRRLFLSDRRLRVAGVGVTL